MRLRPSMAFVHICITTEIKWFPRAIGDWHIFSTSASSKNFDLTRDLLPSWVRFKFIWLGYLKFRGTQAVTCTFV
jgi:hypothetical protein